MARGGGKEKETETGRGLVFARSLSKCPWLCFFSPGGGSCSTPPSSAEPRASSACTQRRRRRQNEAAEGTKDKSALFSLSLVRARARSFLTARAQQGSSRQRPAGSEIPTRVAWKAVKTSVNCGCGGNTRCQGGGEEKGGGAREPERRGDQRGHERRAGRAKGRC